MTSSEHASRRLWRAALGFAAAGWVVLSAPWLFGDVTVPYDAKAHFHPQLQFLANAIHAGQSPFWNPHIFAGSPQIADPQSLIFSPAGLIGLITSHVGLEALDIYVLVMVGLAGLAAMLFFRDKGWHPLGGLVAGTGVAFGASATWRIQHIGQIQSYALLVLSLWLLARALARGSMIYGALAGAAIGLMIAQPDQVAYLGGLMLAGYVIADTASRGLPRKTLAAVMPVLSVAAVVTLMVAIVPVTLTYLFAAASNRAEIPFAEVIRGSFHPASLLTAVVGDLYGAHSSSVHYWGPYSSAWNPDELTLSQNMSQIYVGALAILLILSVGVWRGLVWKPEIRFFTASLIVVLVYGLGGFTPLFRLFYEFVPGVSLFRRPADATFLIGICLAFVGGYLVSWSATGRLHQVGRYHVLMEAGFVGLVVLTGLAVAYREGRVDEAVPPILVAIVLLLSAGSVAYVLSRYARSFPLLCMGMVSAFLVVDLVINNGPSESTALPKKNYEMLRRDTNDETIAFLKSKLRQDELSDRRDRVELVGIGFSWPNLGMIHGFDHTLGYNPMRLEQMTSVFGAGDTIAGWDQRKFAPLFPSYDSVLGRLMGLRYIVTPVPVTRIDRSLAPGQLQLVHRTARAYIYRNAVALPRVLFASRWQQPTSIISPNPATGRRSTHAAPCCWRNRQRRMARYPMNVRAIRANRIHGLQSCAITTPRWKSKLKSRQPALSCSTTFGIRGGLQRWMARRLRSSRRTSCFGPFAFHRGATGCFLLSDLFGAR